MIIKEIVIQGFKSFKEKTVISIDRPAIGIVGPNGCGKSNIVDAMKWVLGEQSAKSLRGEAMDDVIYNGGAKGKGAGMAEVSITFSTEDGKAPSKYIDFSDIQLTRRLYKSGDSEYLINKTPCRLKDIHDLLMGTGAGARAYAIVSQGQIEKFTMAKPRERRVYIEEAAGITRYKVRKEAAERKIQSTKQNLLRLNDIIKELQRQNASLKRQAEAAERYKKLKEELRDKELQYSSTLFNEIQERIENYTATYDELQTQVAGLESDISTKELSIEDRKLAVQKEETFLNDLQEKVYDGLKQLQEFETDIKVREKEIEELKSQMENDEKFLSNLREKLSKLKNEDSSLGSVYSSAHEEIKAEKERLEGCEREFEEQKRKQTAKINERDENKAKIIEVLTNMSQARNRTQFIDENLTATEVRIEQKEKEKAELTEKENIIQSKLENELKELENIKASRDNLENEKETLKERLHEWKNELSKNQAEYDHVKHELAIKSSRLSSLEELRNNFDGYQDGVKSIMLDYPRKDALHGLLGDALEVDPQYETALESVLGDKLQGIVINKLDDGGDAIGHLRATTSGRSNFLPLNPRKVFKTQNEEYKPLSQIQDSAFIGYLKEKVKIKSDYQSVAEHVFDNVALVNDLPSAIRIWNEHRVSDTMVTLTGDVITPDGEISGGSAEAISTGILQSKREIEELNEKIDELEVKHKLITETVQKVQGEIEEAEEKENNLVQWGHAEDLRILNLEKDVSSLKQDLERTRQNKELIDHEIERLKAEIENLEAQRVESKKIIGDCEIQKCDIEKRIAELEYEESELRQVLEKEAEKITEMKVNFASLRERVESVESRKGRLEDDIRETTENIQSFIQKIEEAKERELRLAEENTSLRNQIDNLIIVNDKASQNLKERREQFQNENQDIFDVESQLKELRHQFQAKNTEFNKIQLQLSEAKMKIESLIKEIFEKFGDELEEKAKEIKESNKLLQSEEDMEKVQTQIRSIRSRMDSMGEVNIMAIEEYHLVSERLEFLVEQRKDLEKAISSLEKTIVKINNTTMERFEKTFNAINEQFKKVFPKLFRGGSASLVLTDPNDLLASGVDIVVQPPGKKFQNINLFSGGEKALTAISLIFSIFLINPAPFCVLDEVDAPLDDSNIARFNNIIREMCSNTQFVLITHNKRTMEVADKLYGVTMEDEGYSKMVSVKFVDLD